VYKKRITSQKIKKIKKILWSGGRILYNKIKHLAVVVVGLQNHHPESISTSL